MCQLHNSPRPVEETEWCATVSRLGLASLLCLVFAFGVRGQDAPDAKKPTVTFESFLRNPPVMADAEFEMQMPPLSAATIAAFEQRAEKNKITSPTFDSFTNDSRLIRCSIKYDGGSFMLNRAGSYGGRFGGVEWVVVGDLLRSLNTNWNHPDDSWSMQTRMISTPVRRLVNLGIEEMEPGTATWEKGADHFTARACRESLSTEGNASGIIEVRLTYSNGLPVSAVVTQPGSRRNDQTLISYKYDPAFFDGRLPVEFTTVKLLRGPAKLTLSIKKLEISKSALGAAELDPAMALAGKYRHAIKLADP
jgi:hypothetical protein